LSKRLGCPVLPVVASEHQGIAPLKAAIADAVTRPHPATFNIRYDQALEQAIASLSGRLTDTAAAMGISPRWLAVRLLEGDDLARNAVDPSLHEEIAKLALDLGEDIDIMMADARFSLANRIAGEVITVNRRISRDLTNRIDRIVLNRALGIPIFLFMMYLMFVFTINIGGAFIDCFDQLGQVILVDGFSVWLARAGAPDWLTLLLAKGIGSGAQVVATFIPVIGFLFLFLSMLEDSGYMARAAFVMDRFMRWIGLPGKSFVPLIIGFGCNVPAIMATRTLEHRRDRLMTIAMAPFMSCGARLPVYALFTAAFFAGSGQNIVFSLYVIGIVVAVLTGLILKSTLLQGEATPFIMELPPYHLPTFRGVGIHAWDRLKGFIFRAGKVIVPMVLVLNVLNTLGTDGSYGNEDSEKSVLAAVGRAISPVFAPFGLDQDNWPATVGIFTGILAKEAVVGTLNATYSALAETGEDPGHAEPFDLWAGIGAAFATVPANLAEALSGWLDPLGLDIGDVSDQPAAAEKAKISAGTFGAMANRFDGPAGAFAYLLFILLYMPCTATIAAIYQESGPRWTVFIALWSTVLGYGLATLYYQAATWNRHPAMSLAWIMTILAAFTAMMLTLRYLGLRVKAGSLSLSQ
jgi:ferrous iron transport protein B